jgi:acetyl-CoA carboxylase biotin carboxyl carrier protein
MRVRPQRDLRRATLSRGNMAKDKTETTSPEHQLIRDLASLLNETGLTEIEIEKAGLKVRVARQVTMTAAVPTQHASAVPASSAAAPAVAVVDDPSRHPGCVKSPMVGSAYLSPEPGAPAFAGVGTRVTAGQTLLIIEAMKTMNHIPAPKAGLVTQVLIENGQGVEFGEPLVIIE